MNVALFGSLEAGTAQNAKGCVGAGLKAGHKQNGAIEKEAVCNGAKKIPIADLYSA